MLDGDTYICIYTHIYMCIYIYTHIHFLPLYCEVAIIARNVTYVKNFITATLPLRLSEN